MSEVRAAASSRRISFLVAEKSMKRAFIGFMARVMQSSASSLLCPLAAELTEIAVSVVRANDNAKSGTGKLYLQSGDSSETTVIRGIGTNFTSSLAPKKQLMLGKQYNFATVQVVEVVSDTEVKVKKGFSSKASEALVEEGKKIDDGDKGAGLDFKILPHIDQVRPPCLSSEGHR